MKKADAQIALEKMLWLLKNKPLDINHVGEIADTAWLLERGFREWLADLPEEDKK